jgi:hypothetical protein
VGDPRVAAAWIDTDADFSVFKRVVVFEPKVAFRADWMRDQNRNSRMRRVSQRDMDRIRGDVAELFQEVFTERLQAGGYEIVTVVGDDVLVLRPSIIDLDVNVTNTSATARPPRNRPGPGRLYLEGRGRQSPGSATDVYPVGGQACGFPGLPLLREAGELTS